MVQLLCVILCCKHTTEQARAAKATVALLAGIARAVASLSACAPSSRFITIDEVDLLAVQFRDLWTLIHREDMIDSL